ncbi:hypothetical protein F0U44_13360 [Nocardioides humilatus]|uniref:Uncharacterized protein n=1 Tax=Nocardioides humilatus TaxID=2607660 RepID=A0A5B1LGS9_9ACTN|nr:hypothetical protein [Nocardioides humilatus]KAA1419418.1 hypothetical protein F0U44_13360 [Nocardioides humilatus]
MTATPVRRRALLVSLVLVVVVCLGVTALVVFTRGSGDSFGDKLQSLKDDAVPATAEVKDREELLSVSREFATRFNTYDPSMLDEEGHLPAYAEVSELMSPKFADLFKDFLQLPEKTVAQLGVSSVGTVYAVGVASQDDDSASVLVAGTIEQFLPYDKDGEKGDGETTAPPEGDDQGQLSTGAKAFRYEIDLVKVNGTWLIDDFDDVDDGQPSFAQPQVPEQVPSDQGTETPSDSPTAPTTPTTESTEGEQ